MQVCLCSRSREDFSRLKLPRTIEDAKDVGRLLSKYKDTHYFTVLAAVVSTYVLYPSSNMHVLCMCWGRSLGFQVLQLCVCICVHIIVFKYIA